MRLAGCEQRFTDLLLLRLTSATADPQAVQAEVPKAAPVPFGVDPAAREGAGACSGQCRICLEDHLQAVQLCWGSACTARFCSACVGGFATEAVSRALYAVPWLPCPECGGRISTAAWSAHAREAFGRYENNAKALLTFRCSECHEVGSLFAEADRGPEVLDSFDATVSMALRDAWPSYAYATSPPEALLNLLPEMDPQVLLGGIADLERRTCLHLARLRRNPFIMTPCCETEFCFKCKVGSHHEGSTCEERQREELDIHCQFCPDCEVPTVRTEGCDHIVCVCGAEWTWQESMEAGYALGPAAHLREILNRGGLDPSWANADDSARTLLMYAIRDGRNENALALLEARADLQARDGMDYSALLYAFGASNGAQRVDLCDMLLERKAEVARSDAIIWMSSQGSSGERAPGLFARILELSGAEVNEEHRGQTLLQAALKNARIALANDLIDNRSARVNRLDPFVLVPGWQRGSVADCGLFVKVFAASGLGVDEENAAGQTLVRLAVDQRKQELVRELLTKHGATARVAELALPGPFWTDAVLPEDILDVLVKQGAALWEPGGTPPVPGDGGRGWLLDLAVQNVRYADGLPLGSQARTAAKSKAEKHAAALVGRLIGALWCDAAELFARTQQGAVLLCEASSVPVPAVARRLLEARAGLEAKTKDGQTALQAAVGAKSLEIVELLLAAGADVLARKIEGDRPLVMAEKAKWSDGVAVLREASEVAARRAACSGDGSVANVGIRLDGAIQCPDCRQRFETEQAQCIHWRFIHDPSRHQED